MRILAFTDPHGSSSALAKVKTKAKNADLILCMGDITVFDQNMKKILKKIDSFGKTVLMIPGNHEDEDELEELCSKTKNVIYINDSYYATDDLIILASEGNGFLINDKGFKKKAKNLKKVLNKHKGKKYILMTHAPPYNTKLDILIDHEHCGNNSIREFILQTKPDIALSGHIHENNYVKDKLGKTKLLNPGPEGRFIRI